MMVPQATLTLEVGLCLLYARLFSRFDPQPCARTNLTAFELHRVVPDVLATVPKQTVEVLYRDEVRVESGNVLTPTETKEAPINVTWTADKDKHYVLLMIDPDAPSRTAPLFRELRHWLIVNIPGNDWRRGDVISGYFAPGPPAASGLHRFVFLVYEQPDGRRMKFPDIPRDPVTPELPKRIRFSTRAFAEKYKLGEPVAGNLFKASWDEAVPRVRETLRALTPRLQLQRRTA